MTYQLRLGQDVPDYTPPTDFPDIWRDPRISLDLECQGLDPRRNNGHIVGVGIRTDNWKGNYYPTAHLNGQNCNKDHVMSWLRDGLKRYKGEIVGANVALFDADFLQCTGIQAPNAKWRDIQWAEPLLDESAFSYGLDALATKYLGMTKQISGMEEKYGLNWKEFMEEVHPAHLQDYTQGDLSLPLAILDKQLVALKSERLLKLYYLECRLAPFLHYMKRTGVRVNLDRAQQLSDEFAVKITELSNKLNELAGAPVNFRPSGSLFAAFDRLGIQYPFTEATEKQIAKGKTTGNPSCTGDWLKTQAHPFCALLREIHEYDKIKGTFIDGYILNSHVNGRIHCNFNPLKRADEDGNRGTVSGRFSSTDPNLQNIPVRTELGKLIRALFLPEVGMDFFSRDYSQIEYRLLVHFAVTTHCKEAEVAQKMYIDDPTTDFHAMVAELTGLDRKPAKNLNFGLVYGMGKEKLARTLGVSAEEADRIMTIYHSRAPFIKDLFNKAMNKAQDKGYITTLLKRRARFNEMEKMPEWRGTGQQRARTHKSLNCILQGSAADMMKKAMVDIWESGLIHEGGPLQVHMTVHDELDGSVAPGVEGDIYLDALNNMMEIAIPLVVPVKCDGSIGKNWAEAH
jgi:DNA polymerase I-like protein with 3'-5' exonuclease and polymerase domains